jgi:hypothetical protein
LLLCYHNGMIKSSSDNTTPRWKRSAVKGTLIGVRLQPSQLKALDAWIDKQDASLTRPEAIRAMMETILHILSKDRGDRPAKKAKIR